MKSDLHPSYIQCTVICSCGNTFKTMSTVKEIQTEICSTCHPFYTGEQILVDTAGQVDRFQRKIEAASKHQEAKPTKQEKPQPQVVPDDTADVTNDQLLKSIRQQLVKEEEAKITAKKPAKAPAKKL